MTVTAAAPARLTAPAAVRRIGLPLLPGDLPLGHTPQGVPYRSLFAVVFDGDRPVGTVVVPAAEGVVPERDLAAAVAPLIDAAIAGPAAAPGPAADGAAVSVVITTCAQPDRAARAVASILEGTLRPLEVIVVENRPVGSTTAARLAQAFPGAPVRTVAEPRRGLSAARNAGARHARGAVIAFTDDDVVAGPDWLARIAAAMRETAAHCVTGLILPMRLDTCAQVLLEQWAGFGKGFDRRVFRLASPPPGDPLFPYAPGAFGSGASIAVRRETLVALGGFDVRLGAGTPARGGEDLDLFLRLILTGCTITYEPGAVVWHDHPDTDEALERQAFSYGIGLGAMLTRTVQRGPRRLRMVGRLPAGARYLLDPRSRKNARAAGRLPRKVRLLELAGIACGPVCLLRSVASAERRMP